MKRLLRQCQYTWVQHTKYHLEIKVHNPCLQEPKEVYNEVRIIPITKIDRQAADPEIKESIEGELDK